MLTNFVETLAIATKKISINSNGKNYTFQCPIANVSAMILSSGYMEKNVPQMINNMCSNYDSIVLEDDNQIIGFRATGNCLENAINVESNLGYEAVMLSDSDYETYTFGNGYVVLSKKFVETIENPGDDFMDDFIILEAQPEKPQKSKGWWNFF